VFAVAWKLRITEERLQKQSCLFQTGDYRNKGHNSDKMTWVLFPTKKFSVDWKLSTTENGANTEVSCFSKKIKAAKATDSAINLS
jgi:hypothetical protein